MKRLKKEEPVCKPSFEEEIASLKRQLAGSKGRNKQLAEENNRLKEKVAQITDALSTENECTSTLKQEVLKVRLEREDYKAIVEWYNKLPWWRKIFVGKIYS